MDQTRPMTSTVPAHSAMGRDPRMRPASRPGQRARPSSSSSTAPVAKPDGSARASASRKKAAASVQTSGEDSLRKLIGGIALGDQ